MPPSTFRYDSAAGTFAALDLGSRPAVDASAFVVSDLSSTAADGVQVPLTLIRKKDAVGPQITLLEAYGSYGISLLPNFGPRTLVLLQEGVNVATCHVRGGGELGEQWRLAGKDANKPNTWRDLIACAQDLIARGATTKDTLFISGGSAGGITVGMALTERPDLFAGVIDAVPAANTTRDEFSPDGPPNIPEFGTITNRSGFENLYAMDSYQHVKDGVVYPATLITTGLNDPRVSSWEPAKFAARLQASGTPNPVLLRIETDGGHGVGSTASQQNELAADTYSFIFWRARPPGLAARRQTLKRIGTDFGPPTKLVIGARRRAIQLELVRTRGNISSKNARQLHPGEMHAETHVRTVAESDVRVASRDRHGIETALRISLRRDCPTENTARPNPLCALVGRCISKSLGRDARELVDRRGPTNGFLGEIRGQ